MIEDYPMTNGSSSAEIVREQESHTIQLGSLVVEIIDEERPGALLKTSWFLADVMVLID